MFATSMLDLDRHGRRWPVASDRMAEVRTHRSSPLADVVLAPRGEGSVALALGKGLYLELDHTATEIVELVQVSGTTATIHELVRRYGLPAEVALHHVSSVVAAFEDAQYRPTSSVRRPTLRGVVAVTRSWIKLPPRFRRAVVEAAVQVAAIEVLIRLRPLDQVANWLGTPLVEADTAQGPPLDVKSLAVANRRKLEAVAWVHRSWPWDPTCLRRALAAGWILRRQQPKLMLGLTDSASVIAHAWIVVGGLSLDAEDGAISFRSPEAVRA